MLLTAWIGFVTYLSAELSNDLVSIQHLSRETLGRIRTQDLDHFFGQMQWHTRYLEVAATPLLVLAEHLDWVPYFGPDLRAIPALLQITRDLSTLSKETLLAYVPITQQLDQTTAVNLGSLLGHPAALRVEHLLVASTALQEAESIRAHVDERDLSPWFVETVAQVDNYLRDADMAIKLAQSAPNLLGSSKPQTYLILLQNQDELRPTGGFIGGVGILTFDQGAITKFVVQDSLTVDDFARGPFPPPPEPLRKYMGLGLWLVRDANWSPDFRISAQTAIKLYQLSHSQSIDGVIAVDQSAVKLLLAATGPITVTGFPGPVDATNLDQVLRTAWSTQPGQAYGAEWMTRRKNLMLILAPLLLERVTTMSGRDGLSRILVAILTMLSQRHLQVYLTNPIAASAATELRWDGAVVTGQGDYLMLADANVGYNRANALVQQRMDYAVDLSNLNAPTASLKVSYFSRALGSAVCKQQPVLASGQYMDYVNQCYWDYWRILIPAYSTPLYVPSNYVSGDEFATGRSNHEPTQVGMNELGATEIAGIFVMPPSTNYEIHLFYDLPKTVLQEPTASLTIYRLHIQKQAGTDAIPVTIRVNFPVSWAVLQTVGITARPGQLSYDTVLDTDLDLVVRFRQN